MVRGNAYGSGKAFTVTRRGIGIFVLSLIVLSAVLIMGGFWKPFAGEIEETESATKFYFYADSTNGTYLDGNDDRPQSYNDVYIKSYATQEAYDLAVYNDLDFDDDFTLDKTVECGYYYTPDANEWTYYWVITYCTGYVNQTYIPILGDNNKTLCETASSTQILAFSTELSTTLNNTDDLSWYGKISFIDADSELNDYAGFKPYYNLTDVNNMKDLEDSLIYNVISIKSNMTNVLENFVDLNGLTIAKTLINNDTIQFYINEYFHGLVEFTFDFDEDMLGVLAEVQNISYAQGMYGATLTAIDTWTQ